MVNSLGLGGAERQLSLLSSRWLAAGIDQEVVPLIGVVDGVTLDPAIAVAGASHGVRSVLEAFNYTRRAIAGSDGALVIGWMYHSWAVVLAAWFFCGRRSKPLLYCRHGDISSLKFWTGCLAWLCLHIARWVRIPVVFNSRFAMVEHQKLCKNLRAQVIPNAIRNTVGAPTAGDKQGLHFGYLGRNHFDKGVDLLPGMVSQVLLECPDWGFIISGPGMRAWEAAVREQARQQGIGQHRIVVDGTANDPENFYNRIEILVVPSRTESFPNVVVEAVSSGVLVAAAEVGGIPEILSGLLPMASEPAQVAQLAVALSRLPIEERTKLKSATAKAINAAYSIDKVTAMHSDLWVNYVQESK